MAETGIQRVRYFDGQFLGSEDLSVEQAYHLAMRRRHNIAHDSWGIVTGLSIRFVEEDGWFVEPGMAIDIFGRELLLAQRYPVDIKVFDEFDTDSVDVWLQYGRLSSPVESVTVCQSRDEQEPDREKEVVQVRIEASDPANANRRSPASAGALSSFSPENVPPDESVRTWPVFLGNIRREKVDDEFQFESSGAGRPYAGLRGEAISNPSGTAYVRVGTNGTNDAEFAVRLASGSDQETPDLETRLRIQQTGITLNDDTTIRGQLTLKGGPDGGIEFAEPNREEDPQVPVQSGRVYHHFGSPSRNLLTTLNVSKGAPQARAESEVDHELRIVLDGKTSHLARPLRTFVVGKFVEGEFKSILTVRAKSGDQEVDEVIVDGDLLVRKKLADDLDESADVFTVEAQQQLLTAFQSALTKLLSDPGDEGLLAAINTSPESRRVLAGLLIAAGGGEIIAALNWETVGRNLNNDDGSGTTFVDERGPFITGLTTDNAGAAVPVSDRAEPLLVSLLAFPDPTSSELVLWKTVGRNLDDDDGSGTAVDELGPFITGLTTDGGGAAVPVSDRAEPLLVSLLAFPDPTSSELVLWKTVGRNLDDDDGSGTAVDELGPFITGLTTDGGGAAVPVSDRAEPLLVSLLAFPDPTSSELVLWKTVGRNLDDDDGSGTAVDELGPFITGLTTDGGGAAVPVSDRAEPLLVSLLAFPDPTSSELVLWKTVGRNLDDDDGSGTAVDELGPFITGLTTDGGGAAVPVSDRAEPLLVSLLAFPDPTSSELVLWKTVGRNLDDDDGSGTTVDELGPFITGLTTDGAGAAVPVSDRAEPLLVALLAFPDPTSSELVLWKTVGRNLDDDDEREELVKGILDGNPGRTRAAGLLDELVKAVKGDGTLATFVAALDAQTKTDLGIP